MYMYMYILLLVGQFEWCSEVGLHLQVFGNLGNSGILQLQLVKESLTVGLHPQIVLL